MEFQKIINLLDNTPNQPSKFRTKTITVPNTGTAAAPNNANKEVVLLIIAHHSLIA